MGEGEPTPEKILTHNDELNYAEQSAESGDWSEVTGNLIEFNKLFVENGTDEEKTEIKAKIEKLEKIADEADMSDAKRPKAEIKDGELSGASMESFDQKKLVMDQIEIAKKLVE